MTKPRDYRDEADIDEQLDAIRTVPRYEALELYRTCLDCAYAQGRVDGVNAAQQSVRETFAQTIAADLQFLQRQEEE